MNNLKKSYWFFLFFNAPHLWMRLTRYWRVFVFGGPLVKSRSQNWKYAPHVYEKGRWGLIVERSGFLRISSVLCPCTSYQVFNLFFEPRVTLVASSVLRKYFLQIYFRCGCMIGYSNQRIIFRMVTNILKEKFI